MKTKNHILYKPGLIYILLAFISCSTVIGQSFTDKLSSERAFPAGRETTLEIQNKYGKIQVIPWDEDSVSIHVDIFISESSASKLKKLKEDIKIKYSGTSQYIIAKTVIGNEKSKIASEIKSIGNTLAGTNKQVEINYRVQVPPYLDIVLQNKFGDIYMDDLLGAVNIDLSNGVLKANNLEGNSAIKLSFANGMINKLSTSKMTLSYSDLELGEVMQLDLESKSSKVNADKINVLKIDSRRDKLFFKSVEYFFGTGNFTQVWIYDLLRETDAYMKYGQLTIERISPDFSKIKVESEYTDMTFYLDPKSNTGFDILHHTKARLRLPEKIVIEDSTDGKDLIHKRGVIGAEEPKSVMDIKAFEKCYINISIKN